MNNFSTAKLAQYFEFLDDLRESGVTNMYGSSPYLERAFLIPRRDASKIVAIWMRSFSVDKSIAERAHDARSDMLARSKEDDR